MKVGNLRDSNVTLHLSIYQKRDQILDIPAVYLLHEASVANFRRIAQDAMSGLYDYMFINFMRPISGEQLDQFAYELAKTNATHKICKVQAHFLNYQVIAPNLFILPEYTPSYSQVYSDAQVDAMASGLFSLFKSIGKVPLVRVQNSDISERVFRKLAHLYTQYPDSDSIYKKQDRPLLIVLDRNVDLHTPLYHSWSYLSLLQDVFAFTNNKFHFKEEAKAEAITYELDFGTDTILTENAFLPYHEATENIDKAMTQWKEDFDKITADEQSDISQSLTSAMDKIPQMTERKKKADMHVQVATKLYNEIKLRGIDAL